MEPWQLTATAAAAKLREGRLTAEALTRSCLERIAEREAVVKAWTFLDPRLAIAKAREVDKAYTMGALHGLPLWGVDLSRRRSPWRWHAGRRRGSPSSRHWTASLPRLLCRSSGRTT